MKRTFVHLAPVVLTHLTFATAFAAAAHLHPKNCLTDPLPVEWQQCTSSIDCASIYVRCFSEALNKKFVTRATSWLKSCGACDAAALPKNQIACSDKLCRLVDREK